MVVWGKDLDNTEILAGRRSRCRTDLGCRFYDENWRRIKGETNGSLAMMWAAVWEKDCEVGSRLESEVSEVRR